MPSVTIKTQHPDLPTLSRTKLKKLIKEAGSQKALSERLQVRPSTVRNWSFKLRHLNG